jgi:hypothetical protein
MRRSSTFLIVVLLGIAFSGCADKGKPVATTEAADDPNVLAEGVTNVLQGTVLSADETPLEGVMVELISLQLNVTTDPTGVYRFESLEPRDYLVVAQKDGYKTKTQRAIIEDGKIFELNFKLEEKPTTAPYSELQTWTGMLSCQAAYSSSPEVTTRQNCGEALEGVNDDWEEFTFGPGGAQVVVEAVWTSTQDASDSLAVTVESVGFGHQDLVFGQVSGESPLKLPISQTMMSKYYPQGGTIRVSVAAATGALGQPDTLDAGFAIQQEFDVYVTIFYIEPGSPNYTATDGS